MNYADFYGMKNIPFQRDIPPDSLFISRQVEEGLSRLIYTVDGQKFTTLTGPSGVGKSTLLRKLKYVLPKEKYTVFYASDSKLTPRWLYSNFLKEAGHEPEFYRTEGKRRFQNAPALTASDFLSVDRKFYLVHAVLPYSSIIFTSAGMISSGSICSCISSGVFPCRISLSTSPSSVTSIRHCSVTI